MLSSLTLKGDVADWVDVGGAREPLEAWTALPPEAAAYHHDDNEEIVSEGSVADAFGSRHDVGNQAKSYPQTHAAVRQIHLQNQVTSSPAFSHLKNWRRVATRYDNLARNFLATVALAAIIIWWT